MTPILNPIFKENEIFKDNEFFSKLLVRHLIKAYKVP